MSKNLKLFLLCFLVSLPFWWGVNILQKNLEDFFYSLEMGKNPPQFFIAQISQNYNLKPEKTEDFEDFEIEAESVISVEIDKEGKEKVLFRKKESQKMPIASLTKLMTAVVASEFYQPSEGIKISKQAVGQFEAYGNLKVGEILRVEDLLYIMLIESSNDAAFALAEVIGIEGFTNLMNLKAKDIGLENTWFFNPTGLDPEDSEFSREANYSTSQNLVKLSRYLIGEKPEILDILSKKEYSFWSVDGTFHVLKNTNELLGEIPEVIGGKTGYTERAGDCLLLIMEGRSPGNYLINVILNSPNKFEEMRKLIDYVENKRN